MEGPCFLGNPPTHSAKLAGNERSLAPGVLAIFIMARRCIQRHEAYVKHPVYACAFRKSCGGPGYLGRKHMLGNLTGAWESLKGEVSQDSGGGDWDCATCVLPGTARASSCSHPVWRVSVAIGEVGLNKLHNLLFCYLVCFVLYCIQLHIILHHMMSYVPSLGSKDRLCLASMHWPDTQDPDDESFQAFRRFPAVVRRVQTETCLCRSSLPTRAVHCLCFGKIWKQKPTQVLGSTGISGTCTGRLLNSNRRSGRSNSK